jgi:hypothetical protein
MILTVNDSMDRSKESDQVMISKFARTYVILLSVLELLLITSSLLMNLSVWIGGRRLVEQYGPMLFMGALLTAFPIAFLAKERNIWKNEFMNCPVWVRSVAIGFGIYGLVAAFSQTVLLPRAGGPEDALSVAALPLAIDAIPLFVLYAVLRTDWRRSEIVKRSGLSFVVAVVCVVVFISNHSAYLSHMVR